MILWQSVHVALLKCLNLFVMDVLADKNETVCEWVK